MSGRSTPATRALEQAKVAFALREYAHAPGETAFGEEAARGLGVDAARVFKTLLLEADGKHACAIVPVPKQLDLKAAASALGAKKAALVEPAVAERLTGYVVGGISPLGQKKKLPTLLDESARGATIFVSAGRRGLQLELSADDLARVTGATFGAIAR